MKGKGNLGDNTMTDLKEVSCDYAEWIRVAQDMSSSALVDTTANLQVPFKTEKIFTSSVISQEKLFRVRVVRYYEWTG
jgi:hypothetical protein